MLLSRLKISYRFLLVLALSIGVQTLISIQSLVNLRHELIADREAEVKDLVYTAYSIAGFYYDRVRNGLMSDEAAREAARTTIRAMRYQGANYFFVWDQSGVGVAHGSHPEFEGVLFINGSSAAAKLPYVGDMVTKLVEVGHTSSGEGFTAYNMTQPGQAKPVAKIAYNRLFAPWGWNIGTGAYLDDIDATFWKQALTDLLLMACMIITAGVVSYVLANDFSSALRRLSRNVEAVAAGELSGDIRDVDRGDEIGGVAKALLIFRQAMKDVTVARQSEADRARDSELRRQQIETATGDFEHAVNEITAALDTASKIMDECAHVMIEASDHNKSQAETTTETSEEATASATNVAVAAEEIARSVEGIANQAATSARVADSAADEAQVIIGTVEQLAGSVGKINNVSNLIREIAAQTNLLALNATIEAARAGDAGRGFAVVAQEVKSLSSQTEKATSDITQQISTIEQTTAHVVAAMKSIVGTIVQLDKTAIEISGSVQQQDAVSKEIARNAHAAAEMTRNVSTSVARVAEAAAKTRHVANSVLSAGNELAARSTGLKSAVERFLAQVRVA